MHKKIFLSMLLIITMSCNEDEKTINLDISGKKILTIGDSLTACCEWQPYLVNWFNVNWSINETLYGENGHSPMAVGGTWVKPVDETSIYIRAFDAKYYNPDIIFIYVASNDTYENWVTIK